MVPLLVFVILFSLLLLLLVPNSVIISIFTLPSVSLVTAPLPSSKPSLCPWSDGLIRTEILMVFVFGLPVFALGLVPLLTVYCDLLTLVLRVEEVIVEEEDTVDDIVDDNVELLDERVDDPSIASRIYTR